MTQQEALEVLDLHLPARGPALAPARAIRAVLGVSNRTLKRPPLCDRLPAPVLVGTQRRYPVLQARLVLLAILTGRAAS